METILSILRLSNLLLEALQKLLALRVSQFHQYPLFHILSPHHLKKLNRLPVLGILSRLLSQLLERLLLQANIVLRARLHLLVVFGEFGLGVGLQDLVGCLHKIPSVNLICLVFKLSLANDATLSFAKQSLRSLHFLLLLLLFDHGVALL